MQQRISDFQADLDFSVAANQIDTDSDILRRYFPHTKCVEKTGPALDMRGVDYIVTLDGGVKVYVDTKTRRAGCSKFWPAGVGPCVVLEHWSQFYGDGDARNQTGWTLDMRKLTQYIMYKFDPSDCTTAYIFPFLQLNKAFRHNFYRWQPKYEMKPQRQKRGNYVSKAMSVPVSIVIQAVTAEFTMEQTPLPF